MTFAECLCRPGVCTHTPAGWFAPALHSYAPSLHVSQHTVVSDYAHTTAPQAAVGGDGCALIVPHASLASASLQALPPCSRTATPLCCWMPSSAVADPVLEIPQLPAQHMQHTPRRTLSGEFETWWLAAMQRWALVYDALVAAYRRLQWSGRALAGRQQLDMALYHGTIERWTKEVCLACVAPACCSYANVKCTRSRGK